MNFVSTFFGIGYSKYMPGTMGSLCALLVAIITVTFGNRVLLGIMFLVFAFLSFLFIPDFLEKIDQRDPSCVVADEVLGQWLVVLFSPDVTFFYLAIGFIFFRLFDIWKPWPISVADDLSMEGSYSKQTFFIIADDILAAIFSIIVSWFVYFMV